MKHVVDLIASFLSPTHHECPVQERRGSLCRKKVLGRRHRRPESWSSALVSFFEQESGLQVSQGGGVVYVLHAMCALEEQ